MAASYRIRRIGRLRTKSPLVPYTTLFRSDPVRRSDRPLGVPLGRAVHPHAVAPEHPAESRRRRVAAPLPEDLEESRLGLGDPKSTRLNSSHLVISYAVFCWKKKRAI